MITSIFFETRFWLLVVTSVVLPFSIYGVLLAKRAVSPKMVLLLGFCLVVIAGADVYLLRYLSALAKQTLSLTDDVVFLSELSSGLYLLPAMFAGIGINLVSHVLIRHLVEAEKQFEKEHSRPD